MKSLGLLLSRSFCHRPVLLRAAALLAVCFVAGGAAWSQSFQSIPAPREPGAIALGTGGVEGATVPESWMLLVGKATARNIQQATLTPVFPPLKKRTGAAVIIAPGGGFMMLSMENEGWPVAHWLADRGVAAFVLKYRLRPTAASLDAFQGELMKVVGDAAKASPGAPEAPAFAMDDAKAAMTLVKARAAEWGIDPARIGMLGFSAGAILTLDTALASDPANMPAFIAPIYGPLSAVKVPPEAPPMFVALAADDPLFGNKGFDLLNDWIAAKRPVEFHVYQKGSHGFGMGLPGTTSEDWLPSFYHWLKMNGLLKTHS